VIGNFNFDDWLDTLSPTMKIMLREYENAIRRDCREQFYNQGFADGLSKARSNLRDEVKKELEGQFEKETAGYKTTIKRLSTQIKNLKEKGATR